MVWAFYPEPVGDVVIDLVKIMLKPVIMGATAAFVLLTPEFYEVISCGDG